jgi:hypothetical protein
MRRTGHRSEPQSAALISRPAEARGASGPNPQVMLAWRDRTLDMWAAGDPVKERLLKNAREIEEDEGAGGEYRLLPWTVERLPETSHKPTDSPLRIWRHRRDLLAWEFRSVRALDQIQGRQRDLAGWLPVVGRYAEELTDPPFNGRALKRNELAEIIVTSRGNIRQPQAVADWLVRLARDAASNSSNPVKDHKHQLDRVPSRPAAL